MLEESIASHVGESGAAASSHPLAPRGVQRALDFIHANLAAHIHLEDMAAAAHMSVFHFSRTFRRTLGTGPHRYLVEVRIERVKTLLLSGNLALAAIADETGFSDQSHMSKAFRRFTGMSPRAFRNERRIARCPWQACYPSLHQRQEATRRRP